MPVELFYGFPSRVDIGRAEQRLSYPGIMEVNLAECHNALYDFRESARGPFRGFLRMTADEVCEQAGSILVEVPSLRTLPDLESRLECIEDCLDAVDEIRRLIGDAGMRPFTGRYRRSGAALCASLRKLLWQAHDEWCWRSA